MGLERINPTEGMEQKNPHSPESSPATDLKEKYNDDADDIKSGRDIAADLVKNPNLIHEMPEKSYEKLKSYLAGLVDADSSQIRDIGTNINAKNTWILMKFQSGGSIIYDTEKNIFLSHSSSMVGDKHKEVPMGDPRIKDIVNNGGTLFDKN